MPDIREILPFFTIGLFTSGQLLAAEPAWVCPTDANEASDEPRQRALQPQDIHASAIHIEADKALFKEHGTSLLEGDVLISTQDTVLKSDRAHYEKQSHTVSASGNVWLVGAGFEFSSDHLNYNLLNNTGEINNANYQLDNADGRGNSKKLIRESKETTRMEQASYTTCPVGINSWSIDAKTLEFDHINERGTARNLSLRINNKPLVYLPYFSFPLSDKRKSGLLTPRFATDEKSGIRVNAPYYFNLAPNYDLTLTPELLSKRGYQLDSTFRYLLSKHEGSFSYTFLPGDTEYDGRNRYHFDLKHFSKTGTNSELSFRAEGVSDNDYFNDLGTSLAASSTVKLERTLSYTKRKGHWSFSALAQDYQVLDDNTEAYARQPQLTLSWLPDQENDRLKRYAIGEYTFFSENNAVDGHRVDVQAGIQHRFENDFAYITPAAHVQHTSYSIDRDVDSSIHRSTAGASLDTGMTFERRIKNNQWLQTLEPRLFYTYTPFHDQDNIPVFDSSKRTLSYSQLFNSNRFTGRDRVEDANRLSTSITTRIQNLEKGREVFRASVGQTYHFNDRKVSLPDETLATGSRSELVFEAAGELNASTRMTATAFVDTQEKSLSASQFKINYKDKKERLLNIGYSQRRNEYEAAHISFATPVTRQWKLAGGYEQDLENERMLESVLGLEYRSCCWKGRIAARKYLLSDNTSYDDAIFVEVELKGLGDFGSGARDFLGNRIYGYE